MVTILLNVWSFTKAEQHVHDGLKEIAAPLIIIIQCLAQVPVVFEKSSEMSIDLIACILSSEKVLQLLQVNVFAVRPDCLFLRLILLAFFFLLKHLPLAPRL